MAKFFWILHFVQLMNQNFTILGSRLYGCSWARRHSIFNLPYMIFFSENIDSHGHNIFLIFKILNVLVAQLTHNKDEGPNFH